MFAGQGAYTDAELKETANATLGWWHHSIENRLDKMDWKLMQEHIRMYAAYLWELTTAPVLPFRFVPVAEQVIARLEEFKEPGRSVGIEGAQMAARAFTEAAAKIDAASSAEAERFKGGRGSEPAALVLNGAMKRLSRVLVPLQSTAIGTYGHDPYGYTPQTTMIPCLYDLNELAALDDGEQRWMLETKLVRARNRVADALQDSAAIIHDALAQLK
jgi:hypothetical protein